MYYRNDPGLHPLVHIVDIFILVGVSTVYLNLSYIHVHVQALQVCEHYQRHEEMVYLLGNYQWFGCSIPVMCMYVCRPCR